MSSHRLFRLGKWWIVSALLLVPSRLAAWFFVGPQVAPPSRPPLELLASFRRLGHGSDSGNIRGPLRVSRVNPRYFADPSGHVVYLTGSHTWANLQDTGRTDPPSAFDYARFLEFLSRHHHNFFRLWRWEQSRWTVESVGDFWIEPHPYRRTGPGSALDGKPKFTLTMFNENYFNRLRERVIEAERRGFYVAVMLFNGWSIEKRKGEWHLENPWHGHPFNAANNINGINGDSNGNDSGAEVHTLANPSVTALQETYVRKVIDTVNDLDNVLYEISNESHATSWQWQYHMIRYIKEYEAGKPKQHPVGMTAEWPDGGNGVLFSSPADWISPNSGVENYRDDPQPAQGRKVILSDTDHLCGICGNREWVWKSFLRGLNPVFMDIYDGRSGFEIEQSMRPNRRQWVDLRINLGYTLAYAKRLRLQAMIPRGDLASSGYCLASPSALDAEYLVFLPNGANVVVDLSASPGVLKVEWMEVATGNLVRPLSIQGGSKQSLTAPFSGAAVLYLSAR